MEKSNCYECDYYVSELDEITLATEEWCEKGHHGLKGFPFKTQVKCHKQADWCIAFAD